MKCVYVCSKKSSLQQSIGKISLHDATVFDECRGSAAPVLLELRTSITAAARSGSTAPPSVGGVGPLRSACRVALQQDGAHFGLTARVNGWHFMGRNVGECE